MVIRSVCWFLIITVLAVCSCGGNHHQPSPTAVPLDYGITALDADGVPLPAEAVRASSTPGGLVVEVLDPAVAAVEVRYDATAWHAVEITRGDWFDAGDLFLSVSHPPGLAVAGGYHLSAAPALTSGARLATISFATGPGPAARPASALPTGDNARPTGFEVNDAGDGTALLTWAYQNTGDYNQDGEVGVSDLTPIGQNFNKRAGDTGWDTAALADGNRDSFITASDLTPVGTYYLTRITGYAIESAASAAGPFSEDSTVAVGDGEQSPWLEFSTILAAAVDGNYYRVRAYHNSDTTQGAASDAREFTVLDPGSNPEAAATVTPDHGTAPLQVSLSATGSTDSDGTIAQYLWDLDGDQVYELDATAQSGAVSHVFSEAGTYSVRLKVIDDSGRWDTAAAVVYVTGSATADPPEAYAHAMPCQGWGPLTVYFSSYGTTDDGVVMALEWDLDGDGTYETDATAAGGYTSYTYTTPGTYNAGLRATDDTGALAYSTAVVEVRDRAASSVDYWSIFDQAGVGQVLLEVQQEDWDEMWAVIEDELEIPSDVTVFGETLPDCGLKFKGNGSLWGSGEKKPWKVDTNEFVDGQEFQNMKMLIFNNNFDDPSMLREKMAYDMLQFAGVDASFTSFVEIWVDIHGDGVEPIFWGVYTMVERVDKKFLANRFGQDNDGDNLYKADAWFEEGGADLAYYGEDINDYPMPRGEIAYGKETNASEADYSDIIELCRVIDGTEYASDAQFMAALEGVLNVDSFLRYMACMVVLDNWDCYPFSANNYYLYHDPVTDQFQWIPWDENSAWSGEVDRSLVVAGEWGGPVEYAPLQRKVFVIEDYLRDYAAYIDLLRRHWFNAEQVEPTAEGWHDLVEPFVKQGTGDKMYYGDTAAWPVAGFDTNWDSVYPATGEGQRVGICEFTTARGNFIDENLAGVYSVP